MTDGIQINNAMFESSGTLISCNLDLRKAKPLFSTHIVLGHQGNMERYVFSSRNNGYQTVSFFSPEDVLETHDGFDALLTAVIGNQVL